MSPIEKNIARWRENLPEALWMLPIWVLWQRRPRPGKPGEWDKLPYYTNGTARHGKQGSSKDRRQLAEFGDVLAAYVRSECVRDGIGAAPLPDIPVWYLDQDKIDTDPKRQEFANRVIASGTYVEYSPSGRGLRAIFAGKIGLDKKNLHVGLETFDSQGFVTLTGAKIAGDEVIPCPPDLATEILSAVTAGSLRKSTNTAIPDAPAENLELLKGVRLPMKLRARLANPYPNNCDRSAAAFSIALSLARCGVSREAAMEVMSLNELLVPALERRAGDIESARAWMWRYVVSPAYAAGVVSR